ncbi:MAG: hypothetical protein AB8B85_21900 [Paracoccaceae bacterium]
MPEMFDKSANREETTTIGNKITAPKSGSQDANPTVDTETTQTTPRLPAYVMHG